MNPHSLPKKKELGAYYTPPALSQVLADWAILRSDQDVLEPSFGGCGFFDSSIARLRELGCSAPEKQLYGVDIDEHAFEILNRKFRKSVDINQRFILKDFIQVKPSEFSVHEFDVVLGNPPYVSMHNMTHEQRLSCDSVLRNSPFSGRTIGRNASLWAFFLLHSLEFVKEGGRVAWVLPSSLLHADYAEKLIQIHQRHFEKIKVLKLAERFFKEEGAQETSVILLAQGFHKKKVLQSNLSVKVVENITELKKVITNDDEVLAVNIRDYKLDIISSAAKFSYQALLQQESTKELEYYVDIKIGMVTGANNYFIINRSTAEKHHLPEDVLKPVVGRFSQLKGIVHNKIRHQKCAKADQRVFLVLPTKEQMEDGLSPVARYLSGISYKDKEKNQTFKKRPHWFAPGWGVDGIKADCFMSYMIHRGPRMVVNAGRQFNCTNSIHKVIFHEKVSTKYKSAMAITMLSTFTQFSAELEGRAYSSGVLKIEPSAGRRIKVLFSEKCIDDLDALKTNVEIALEQDDFQLATQMVDDVLIKHELMTQGQCHYLSKAVHDLRCERYKGVKSYTE